MYIYVVSIYVYKLINVYIYTCTHTHTHTHILSVTLPRRLSPRDPPPLLRFGPYIYIYIYIYIERERERESLPWQVLMHVFMYVCMYVCMCVYIYMRALTQTHTYLQWQGEIRSKSPHAPVFSLCLCVNVWQGGCVGDCGVCVRARN